MTRRFAFLLLTAALGMAAAQTSVATPSVQTVSSSDPQLSSANVTVEIGRYGGPLSSLLAAIAKAAGYSLIFDTNVDALQSAASTTAAPAAGTDTAPAAGTPGTSSATGARPVVYSFQNKPFNEVWPLLMDVYGLSYEVVRLGGQPVLRISNNPIQRVVALKNADATQAAGQVKLFFGTPTYSETPQKDAQGNTLGITRTLVDVKLDSPTLRIVPDVRSNAVIVRGTNKEVAEVERLLAQLDRSGGGTTTTGSTAPGSQTIQRVYSVKGAQADIIAVLAAQYPGLKVTPVGQTGQLVITGPQNQLDAAQVLLTQVDKPTPAAVAAQTTQRVFTLAHAKAEEIKAVLEGTLAAAASNGSTQSIAGGALGSNSVVTGTNIGVSTPAATTPNPTGNNGGAAATPTSTATIIADKRTNTLIVRGTQEQVNQVAELIPTLDVSVPQINLQVRINEITETGLRSLGMGYNVSVGGFNVSLANGKLAASFDPTRSFVGFNLGATLNNLEEQGLTKRVYDGTVMMQSGQSNGAGGGRPFKCGSPDDQSDIAAASLQSGGRLDLNIPGAGGSAPIVRSIPYGVNMYFLEPVVNSDNSVSVRICGQVNQPKTVITDTIPNNLNFTNSAAQTVVSFKSGETLLLSGLLGTNEVVNRTGLPYLTSIPVVGALLGGSERKSKDSTQLLVIVTGTVVK